ncbi:MAG: polymerase sigma-70 factor, subfamily [Actinomycetota bacterium]|nr:polymerase sigma-70 factor, subfamily [Actinomycetota bacterium]
MAKEFPSDLTSLALAARDGDRVALTAFVRQSQAEVWRVCRRLGDLESADDLTQEVYARAITALPRFRGESSARTWLLSIARHVAADRVRANRRRGRDIAEPAPDAPDHASLDAVERLIAGLDDDRRAAFVLTQVLGLSYAETAEVCGVPIGTVRSRVARARDELIETMRKAADG